MKEFIVAREEVGAIVAGRQRIRLIRRVQRGEGFDASELDIDQIRSALTHYLLLPENVGLATQPVLPKDLRYKYPLPFLISTGASLEMVQQFCEAFPDTPGCFAGNRYPLHVACLHCNQLEAGTIAYLARLYPDALIKMVPEDKQWKIQNCRLVF